MRTSLAAQLFAVVAQPDGRGVGLGPDDLHLLVFARRAEEPDGEREENDFIDVTREGDQLVANLYGVKFILFAESPTKFFAKTTDLQLEFPANAEGKVDRVIWSVGEGGTEAPKVK